MTKKHIELTGNVEEDVSNLENLLVEEGLLEVCHWCNDVRNGVTAGGKGSDEPPICEQCLDRMFPG